MKQMFAIAIPIPADKKESWNKFIDELKTNRHEEFKTSRMKLGVRERTFLQSTPMGEFVVVTLEGEHPQEAFSNFGKGDDEFTKWFVAQVKDIHGIDLNNPPKGSMPDLTLDSGEI